MITDAENFHSTFIDKSATELASASGPRLENVSSESTASSSSSLVTLRLDAAKTRLISKFVDTYLIDAAKTRLISKFVDTYLRLNAKEEEVFQAEIDKLDVGQKEEIMQTLTSWEEKGLKEGLKQGMEKGMEKGQRSLILRLLSRKVGTLPKPTRDRLKTLKVAQLESLAEALLDFETMTDLTAWLNKHS
jgi:flagellar biosynthesis/type III secretory pathway protein FliH